MAKKTPNEFQALWSKFQSLIDILPGIVYCRAINGEYIDCNEAQAHAFGFKSKDEIIGKTPTQLGLKKSGGLEVTDNLVMQTGIPVTVEDIYENKKIYLSKKKPLTNDKGEVIGILSVSFDITERKLQEHKLKQEQTSTQLTLDTILINLPGHVFWLNKEGTILGCNKLQAQSLGRDKPEDIIGKTVFELAPPEEAEKLFLANQKVIMTGEPLEIEEELSISSKTKAIFFSQKVPIRDDQGNIVGLLGIALDITSKKRAAELEKARVVSEEKAQTMKMLAASIAHELRTPLASISALTSAVKFFLPILVEAYEIAEKHELVEPQINSTQIESLQALPDDFNQIIHSANTFINMLLAKVNLENAKPTHITTLSIVCCVEKALKQYPFSIGGRELVKWDKTNDFQFKGDELLTIYVLFNLLKNAIYHVTDAGKGEIQIWLEHGEEFNELHFKDTGKGIPADILQKIFEQFYSNTRHGTGVGLAFCKMVINTFNGKINCISVEGEYAHFILSFPVIKENNEN